jgi:16S rRNA (adenine1518-N6/adenine1519-N6)-dimethyltransferase
VELKKSLGQHFLKDKEVLERIAASVESLLPIDIMIEVGPGMGALTQYIVDLPCSSYHVIEKDDRFVIELPVKFPKLAGHIFHQDVLTFDFNTFESNNISVVGNYPYNISNLIMFWIIENVDKVSQSVGMFQKEVARRISSKHGSKEYGILSILAQSLYEVDYLFDIAPESFDPPPKVVSGVISMKRRAMPLADYAKLKKLVKAAFNLRRKMLSNSLKGIQFNDMTMYEQIKNLRPEQLSIEQFCELSKFVI